MVEFGVEFWYEDHEFAIFRSEDPYYPYQDLSHFTLKNFKTLYQGSDIVWFLRNVLISRGQIWENKKVLISQKCADFGQAVWFLSDF